MLKNLLNQHFLVFLLIKDAKEYFSNQNDTEKSICHSLPENKGISPVILLN